MARVARGGIWLAIGGVTARLASFGKLAVLGRLLTPADFGLVAMGFVVMRWVEYVTQTGVKDALIRTRTDIGPYLDTAWTVQLFRSALIAVAVFAGAPVAAWVFATPAVQPIVHAVAVVILLRGLTNPAIVYLPRELDFRREVMWRLSGTLAGLVVAVAVALVWRSVWALVISVGAAQAVETAVSYWIMPYRPHIRLDRGRARELLAFGKWIFFWNFLTLCGSYVDTIVIGRSLGAAELGFYQVASQLAFATIAALGTYSHGVMFPAFSKLQESKDVGRALVRTLTLMSAVALPIACFITVFAGPLVRIVAGPQWMGIVPCVRILAWAGAATALAAAVAPLFQATGSAHVPVWTSVVKLLVLCVLLYPLVVAFGIVGGATAVAVAGGVELICSATLVTRRIGQSVGGLVAAARISAIACLPFAAAWIVVPTSITPMLFLVAALALGAYVTIVARTVWPHVGPGSAPWRSESA